MNVRRLFIYLEHSIDKSTQWVVFEPNNEALWRNVTRTIKDFLEVQWRNGALLGTTPDEAYFVHCDRSTMSQNDLDNGRLICLIGVAPVKPAEFVISASRVLSGPGRSRCRWTGGTTTSSCSAGSRAPGCCRGRWPPSSPRADGVPTSCG